jgi:hypothetical protein
MRPEARASRLQVESLRQYVRCEEDIYPVNLALYFPPFCMTSGVRYGAVTPE